jgi:hypothetical protein
MLKVKPRIMKAVRGVVVLVILVAAGSILLHYTEHVDWFDCVYWTLTTLSTVGYGDIVPKNHKVVFALFFLVSVCLFAYVLGEVVGALVELLKCRRLAAFFKDGLTQEMLQKLDKVDPDGAVCYPICVSLVGANVYARVVHGSEIEGQSHQHPAVPG